MVNIIIKYKIILYLKIDKFLAINIENKYYYLILINIYLIKLLNLINIFLKKNY